MSAGHLMFLGILKLHCALKHSASKFGEDDLTAMLDADETTYET